MNNDPKLIRVGELAEIQGFVRDFQGAGSGREATTRVRSLFTEKQAERPPTGEMGESPETASPRARSPSTCPSPSFSAKAHRRLTVDDIM